MATASRRQKMASVREARWLVSTALSASELFQVILLELDQVKDLLQQEAAASVLKQTESDREVRDRLRDKGLLLGPVETSNPQG